MNSANPSGNESQTKRQQSNSSTDSTFEFEPALDGGRAKDEGGRETRLSAEAGAESLPGNSGLRRRRDRQLADFMTTAAQVRGYLGVSPSAYEDACHVMGQEVAAVVIACIWGSLHASRACSVIVRSTYRNANFYPSSTITRGVNMTENRARGKRIRNAMAERNFRKTHALAAELDVSAAAVSRWQNGGHVSLQSACALAEKLDVSLDWLLLGRGTIDWHKDNQVSQSELQWILLLRTHPSKIKSLLVDLVRAISESR